MSDPFQPEVVTFEAGGKKLEIRPLPLSKLKEALVIFKSAIALAQEAAKQDLLAVLEQVPEIAMDKFTLLAPIVLGQPDLTAEWIGNNISFPLARKILEEASRLNGIQDFLVPARPTGKVLTEPGPSKSPTDLPSSTTPSPSPTDGPLKK